MEAAVALARNAVRLGYEDLPRETVEVTKKSILDTLGVMLAASGLGEGCREMVSLVKEAGGREESTILAFGGKVPCWQAAFANGTMTHPLDYDDTHDGAAVHPTAATLPAALAVAERRGGVGGREFIAAIALGNDLVCRLGLAVTKGLAEHGWLPPQLFGVFGAALAAGKLLGLDEEGMVSALGLALSQAAGSAQVAFDPDCHVRAIRDAFTAKSGVLAALLAQRGILGCRNSLEGKAGLFPLYFKGDYNPEPLTSELGERFEGTYVSFKPYPSCRVTHPFLDAVLGLVKEHAIAPDEIAEVALRVGELGRALCLPEERRRRPSLSIEAKFSLPYSVAAALVRGKVTLNDFTPQALEDGEVLELARKVTWTFDPGMTRRGIEPAEVTIIHKSGARYSKRVEFAYGHPNNPISMEDIVAKFKDCASYSVKPLSSEAVEETVRMVTHLEEVADVAELARLLGGESDGR